MALPAQSHSKFKVVILGGGTAGWMTAAALAKLLPQSKYSFTLIESDKIGTIGVGEATIPHIRYFNKTLGIDEREFMRATNATYKLGIELSNWGKIGDTYHHPFGEFGLPIGETSFHHFWLKMRNAGSTTNIDAYSLPIQLAKFNKFRRPQINSSNIEDSYSYAYHLDASAYAAFLRDYSIKLGVNHILGDVTEVIQNANGFLQKLTLEQGFSVAGDFFIDCSGFSGQLIKKTLNEKFSDWSPMLPCDRAIAQASDPLETLPPFTKAIAENCGWRWQIPLQHRTGNGIVYSSSHVSDDEAYSLLVQNLPLNETTTTPKVIKFKSGYINNSWFKNCVAIGLSSGFLEPLESTSIYLIQVAITKLLELFPTHISVHSATLASEYNRHLKYEYECVRDFLILHYHCTQRDDSEFWNYCRHMAIPDSLEYKIQLWDEAAIAQTYTNGLFLEPSWVALFIGQLRIPMNYDSRADLIGTDKTAAWINNIKIHIDHFTRTAKAHQHNLSQLKTTTLTKPN